MQSATQSATTRADELLFLCDENWEKETEVTLEDMGADSDNEVYLMDETPLIDLIEDEGQRMIFVFDYLTDRCFFVELKKSSR